MVMIMMIMMMMMIMIIMVMVTLLKITIIFRYSSKASLRKSTENMAGGKELVATRESTYPVF